MFNPDKFLAQPGLFNSYPNYSGYGADAGSDLTDDEQLAEYYRRQQEAQIEASKRLTDQLTGMVDDRGYVERAQADAANLETSALEQTGRAQSRSVGGMTAAQQADLERGIATETAATGTSLINQSKESQRAVNQGVDTAIAQIAGGNTNAAIGTLAQVNTAQQQRQAQYEAEKAASASGMLGTIGTVAGGVIGGMFGAPRAGAAIGGGIGSAVGGR